MIVYAKNNQNLFDIAIQFMGDASFAMHIAQASGLHITAELSTGDSLTIPDEIELSTSQQKVVKYYTDNGIVPAGELP